MAMRERDLGYGIRLSLNRFRVVVRWNQEVPAPPWPLKHRCHRLTNLRRIIFFKGRCEVKLCHMLILACGCFEAERIESEGLLNLGLAMSCVGEKAKRGQR